MSCHDHGGTEGREIFFLVLCSPGTCVLLLSWEHLAFLGMEPLKLPSPAYGNAQHIGIKMNPFISMN